MATAPLKSQPLHNFSLPQLRWGHKNQTHVNQRYRRPSDTPTAAAENHHHSPSPSEQESYGGNRDMSRFPMASCSSQKAVIEREEDREKEKPWNLRPRKAVVRIPSNGGELTETAPFSENLPKSTRLRGYVEGQKKEEEEKRKYLWIALCREEIEEDVYSMTGSKPARRPKKRPKTVQKQLDNLFPGLYLAGITPDSYRVYDAPGLGPPMHPLGPPLDMCNGTRTSVKVYFIFVPKYLKLRESEETIVSGSGGSY